MLLVIRLLEADIHTHELRKNQRH